MLYRGILDYIRDSVPGDDEREVGLDQGGSRVVPQVRDQAQHLPHTDTLHDQHLPHTDTLHDQHLPHTYTLHDQTCHTDTYT